MAMAAVKARRAKKKAPAIIHFQPTGFRKVETPAGLKKLAEDVRKFAGITLNIPAATKGAVVYYETVCGTGEFDDCSEEDPGEQLDPA